MLGPSRDQKHRSRSSGTPGDPGEYSISTKYRKHDAKEGEIDVNTTLRVLVHTYLCNVCITQGHNSKAQHRTGAGEDDELGEKGRSEDDRRLRKRADNVD